MWGVEAMTPDGVTVRVTLKTAPMEQWEVAREMRERVKARFDYEGIEIPLPQRVVWHRDDSRHPGREGTEEKPAPDPPSDLRTLRNRPIRPMPGRSGSERRLTRSVAHRGDPSREEPGPCPSLNPPPRTRTRAPAHAPRPRGCA